MTSPLPPPWAARCWVEGNTIFVECPMGDNLPSHRLAFAFDQQAMHRLRSLLMNRNAHSVLGTKGDLTQWQVDKQTIDDKCKVPFYNESQVGRPKDKDSFTAPMRQAARDVMRRLGL